VSIDS